MMTVKLCETDSARVRVGFASENLELCLLEASKTREDCLGHFHIGTLINFQLFHRK